MRPAHIELEDSAKDEPRGQIDTGSWRNNFKCAHHNWNVYISPERCRETPRKIVEGNREKCTDEEEVDERVVERATIEESTWPNASPNDRSGSEGVRARAGKAVLLMRRAQIRDVSEHPLLYNHDHHDAFCSSEDLSEEHRPRWDLHVMAELEVSNEEQRLLHRNEAECLENHHGDWAAWKHIANDKLAKNLDSDRLVRKGANDTNRDDEHSGDQNCNEKAPDR